MESEDWTKTVDQKMQYPHVQVGWFELFLNIMAHVRFTKNLYQFFPGLEACDVAGQTVAELIRALDHQHPRLASYIVDDSGALRPHVNIFVGNRVITDRKRLSDAVDAESNVYIAQALSGG